jgi:hypothetical protein
MFIIYPNTYDSISVITFSAFTTTTCFKVEISATSNFIVLYASALFTSVVIVPDDGF